MPLQSTNPAAVAAAQIENQVNGLAMQVANALANGIPARGNQAAISAADLAAAIGTINVAKLNAMIAALA